MHVTVNGVRLYVDIEGAGLVPDGPRMREKPTLVLLHGGPGFDHSMYKPIFSALSDIAQIVYFDHRGCGRSENGPTDRWRLDQWGDDVRTLCDTLGIENPIVLGTSFGGFMAQAYATRHPGHAAKLILISTAARFDFQEVYAAFERLGGAEAEEAARGYWSAPSDTTRAVYRKVCVPLYAPRNHADDGSWLARAITRNDTGVHFNGPDKEHGRFDFRDALAHISCPVLVMAGDNDPITPIVFSEQIAASLPPERVRFKRFAGCGHGIVADDRDGALQAIRDFIHA